MTEVELQELSNPYVDGANKFERIGHEKGIQQGALPDDLEEDQSSNFSFMTSGDMVKQLAKHVRTSKSPTSFGSKDKSNDKGKEKDKSKGKEKTKKNRHHKHPQTKKNNAFKK